MRAVWATVQGAGRLVDASIKLGPRLIAVVGPNEAGKSTLLRALSRIETGDALAPAERSRGGHVDDASAFVSVHYRLDDDDRLEVDDLGLVELPRTLTIRRLAGGGEPILEISPHPRIPDGSMTAAVHDLQRQLDDAEGTGLPWLNDPKMIEPGSTEHQQRHAAYTQLRLLAERLVGFAELSPDKRQPPEAFRPEIESHVNIVAPYTGADDLRETLDTLRKWFEVADPVRETADRLRAVMPRMLLFTDEERSLASTYVIDENLVAVTPPALANLLALAGIDIAELFTAIQTSQISRRDTIKNKGNRKLREHFAETWRQADLRVELNIEDRVLRVNVVENDVYTSVFDERSEGLKAFVAMNAFVAAKRGTRPIVLLIDEAENHLHVDAQADLIEMFSQQNLVEKIVYTTHSPACLPSDLGLGIRAVVPDAAETSRISNSFWTEPGRALTSLMLTMGAGAAAFTPARCVVIAEGASEMILLPSLIREATGLDKLPYQITYGLAEVPPDLYPQLDFEAARVAYLVDGDKGGEDLAVRVGRALPANLIINLGVPGIENILDPAFYRQLYVDSAADLAGIPHPRPTTAPALRSKTKSWAKFMDTWALGAQLPTPSKTYLAAEAAEMEAPRLSASGANRLVDLHRKLCAALGLADTA